MPYSSHTHFTALGGSILLFGFTPNCSRCELFSLSQRQKVVRLTPAASARSDLYMLFIGLFLFLTTDYRLQTTDLFLVRWLLSVDCCLFLFTNLRKNIGICKFIVIYLFQIVSVRFNASENCRTFVLDLGIHHKSAFARDSKSAACSALAKTQTCSVIQNITRESGQFHTWSLQITNVTMRNVTLYEGQRNTLQSQS